VPRPQTRSIGQGGPVPEGRVRIRPGNRHCHLPRWPAPVTLLLIGPARAQKDKLCQQTSVPLLPAPLAMHEQQLSIRLPHGERGRARLWQPERWRCSMPDSARDESGSAFMLGRDTADSADTSCLMCRLHDGVSAAPAVLCCSGFAQQTGNHAPSVAVRSCRSSRRSMLPRRLC
jgi:hypothetical protein